MSVNAYDLTPSNARSKADIEELEFEFQSQDSYDYFSIKRKSSTTCSQKEL